MNTVNRATRILLCLTAGLFLHASADEPFSADQVYGGEVPAAGEALSLKQAIAGLEQGHTGLVKIQGRITEVCQTKGCWMIMVEGDTYARITFENYGYFVPMETSMQRSVIYGWLSEEVLSGEQAEHFAEDAGEQSTLKLEGNARGEVREYSILARGVQLENRG